MRWIFIVNMMKIKLRRKLCMYRHTLEQRNTQNLRLQLIFRFNFGQNVMEENAKVILSEFLMKSLMITNIYYCIKYTRDTVIKVQ